MLLLKSVIKYQLSTLSQGVIMANDLIKPCWCGHVKHTGACLAPVNTSNMAISEDRCSCPYRLVQDKPTLKDQTELPCLQSIIVRMFEQEIGRRLVDTTPEDRNWWANKVSRYKNEFDAVRDAFTAISEQRKV